ncbi:MAG: hypothetical protein DI636_04720 [Pelagerythrobacter marensis]|nr:MAG: hypothetical protein DI636_04720 [Pelagerythrobacter marensis]
MSENGKSVAKSASKEGNSPTAPKQRKGQRLQPVEDIARVALAGRFAENVTIVPHSFSAMVLSTGYLEQEKKFVLLPFIEMSMRGMRQGELPDDGEIPSNLETIFDRTLPLENAVWLVYDLIRDMRQACERLSNMVEGSIGLENDRLAQATDFAAAIAEEAVLCSAALATLNKTRGKSAD